MISSFRISPRSDSSTPQQRADHACKLCRARKRACDKILPTCSYCIERNLTCIYNYTVKPVALSETRLPGWHPTTSEVNLAGTIKREVLQCLEASASSPERVCEQYFNTIHPSLPIVFANFLSDRFQAWSSRQPEWSLMLLCMHLLTSTNEADQESYITLKSLTTTVQAVHRISVPLVQIYLLVAAFEYQKGWLESAATSLAVCSRIARILKTNRPPDVTGTDISYDRRREMMEAWNTWCAIIMLETVILSEINLFEDRPCTAHHAILRPFLLPVITVPTDGGHCHGNTGEPEESSFYQQMQAVDLLSHVHNAILFMKASDDLLQLDAELKSFLQDLLHRDTEHQTPDQSGAAIAITIRALFILHKHNIDSILADTSTQAEQREHMEEVSRATLGMVTRLMLDTAASDSHQHHIMAIHALPLCCRTNIENAMDWGAEMGLDGVANWRLMELKRHLSNAH